ncbi:Protein Wnt-2b [Halocaridina rubra]|uniref:Protein Wnt n=1 Tax=Halocaridina rubra TaxID=373956 RepID=A0AAN8WIV2_HALRR
MAEPQQDLFYGICSKEDMSELFVSQLSASYSSTRVHCENIPGLVRRQRVLCERHPDAMMAVTEGATLGVRQCQKQFQDSRWNCSTFPRDSSVFGRHVLRSKCPPPLSPL